ncbi:universal stress protein [Streptomyces monashensis]|uniref:universal stress protein n=1 Tax=Streptomyces monashensis TaxID=1678012 RepID=UPI003F540C9F
MGNMTLPLVVGVDGSDSCLRAVDWAVAEAARHGLPLRLVYGSLWERYEGGLPPVGHERPSEQVLAEHVVAAAADRAARRDTAVTVTTDILPEDAADALVRAGDHAFALVTGSRGRGRLQGMLLGSVGLAVAARAPCPVVVVRGDPAGLAGTHERILLGLGDAETGAEAVRFAFREAEVRGCVLDVVRAWRRPAHDRIGARAAAADTHAERASALLDDLVGDAVTAYPHVRTCRATPEGPPGRILVDRSAAADLVIVGAGHRAGLFGLQLGRVSHALLHHASCPVAVVPQRH